MIHDEQRLHLAIISAAKIGRWFLAMSGKNSGLKCTDYSKGLQGETSPDQKQRVQLYIQAHKPITIRQKNFKSYIKQGRGKVAAD